MGDWYLDPDVKADRLERLVKVADLWNKAGLGVRATARELGVNPSTVSRDRKLLVEMWRERVLADVNDVAARELAKLDAQEAELWLAWERSKRDKTRTSNKEKRSAVGTGEDVRELAVAERTTMTVVEGRLPEARYMDLLIDIGDRRAKLLGLDKGIKLEDLNFDFRELVSYAADRREKRLSKAEAAKKRDEDERSGS